MLSLQSSQYVSSELEVGFDDPLISAALNIPVTLLERMIPGETCISKLVRMEENQFLKIDTNQSFPAPRFSTLPVEQDLDDLANRSIPRVDDLNEVFSLLSDYAAEGWMTFIDPRYSEGPAPLCLVPYWIQKAHELDARRRWNESCEWLGRHSRSDDADQSELALTCLAAFDVLGWNESITVYKTTVATLHLQQLLAECQTSTMIIDAMVDSIGRRLDSEWIIDTFVGSLDVFFLLKNSSIRSNYNNSRTFRSLVDLGNRISDGSLTYLYLPVNIQGVHWAVFRIDASSCLIEYGDSLGWRPKADDCQILIWWLARHGLEGFTVRHDLPCARQPPQDSVSCGIIMINTIRHNIFGDDLWISPRQHVSRMREFRSITEGYREVLSSPTAQAKIDYPPPESSLAQPLSFSDIAVPVSLLPTPISIGLPSLPLAVSNVIPASSKPNTLPSPTQSTLTGKRKRQPEGTLSFGPISTEGYQLQVLKEYDCMRERAADIAAREVASQRRRAEATRKGNCDRKQKQRERQKAKEIASGERDPDGTKRRKTNITATLLPFDTTSLPALNIAEASRPYRIHKDKDRKHKPGNELKAAKNLNIYDPLIWRQIEEVAQVTRPQLAPSHIRRILIQRNCTVFERLSEQVIGRLIDRSGARPEWSKETLAKVAKGYNSGGHSTRSGILDDVPAVRDMLIAQLRAIRAAGVALSTRSVRGIMIGTLTKKAPQIFAIKLKRTGTFSCSTSFVKKFIDDHLQWSFRRVTKAAQKVPIDATQCCQASIYRQALSIRNHCIPAELRVNIDQTQVVISGGSGYTYETIGSKQVSATGHEEKRAFTVLVGVSASGEVLPFQTIWHGKTSKVLPTKDAPYRKEADEIGMVWEASQTDTYWSTFATMCSYLDECILQLDTWSVHRGKPFVNWITASHPFIIRDYVPGGCTGIFQPCDVGIQKLFKAAIRQAQHEDVVKETIEQLEKGIHPSQVRLDTRLGVLRERSVGWLVRAYNVINKPEIVLKAFLNCRVEGTEFNLSQESLKSREVLRKLTQIEVKDRALYADIQGSSATQSHCIGNIEVGPFEDVESEYNSDDSDISDIEE
ncbi:hypothetical protein QCA50_020018 [Cerrena zonata]|uniref:Ubiquitin-like protease family profile domain-containing protein n=1 Tax=Cerrena zonata TaxID=2478898 RepID=A0AAW0FFU5_9APHY